MGNVYQGSIELSIFGESHGAGIGMVLSGVEPGLELDMEAIKAEMKRRAPGQLLSTPRKEADEIEWLSGIVNDTVCGSPIACLIRNNNTKSKDYDSLKYWMRPSHADYPAFVKYHGSQDVRGGGHFSGRITAPLVAAGSILGQGLEKHFPMEVGSHIIRLGAYEENKWDEVTPELLSGKRQEYLPSLNPDEVKAEIEKAQADSDSVGGMVETAVWGVPAGLGDPFFDSVESRLSRLLFSIPAVKGVMFGSGTDFASGHGSEMNDAYTYQDGVVVTKTNHNGGILGGITTGMPIVFTTIIKPTASIGKVQDSVNLKTGTDEQGTVVGRHDPCIVPRAIPVIEAAVKIALYDCWKEGNGFHA